jgi:hypothetical protein
LKPDFRAHEVVLAVASAVCIQGLLGLVFSSASPSTVRANISDERSRPMAVSIHPVSAIPAVGQRKTYAPRSWQRPKSNLASLPSPDKDKQMLDDKDESDPFEDYLGQPSPLSSATESSSPHSDTEPGSGTEAEFEDVDSALRMRALAMYRSELVTWFMSRFEIRGKIPFQTLKRLQAHVTVTVTPERMIGSYDFETSSGNATFDAEVRAALDRIEVSGAAIPAPPPLYPHALGSSLSIRFACTVQSQCE